MWEQTRKPWCLLKVQSIKGETVEGYSQKEGRQALLFFGTTPHFSLQSLFSPPFSRQGERGWHPGGLHGLHKWQMYESCLPHHPIKCACATLHQLRTCKFQKWGNNCVYGFKKPKQTPCCISGISPLFNTEKWHTFCQGLKFDKMLCWNPHLFWLTKEGQLL